MSIETAFTALADPSRRRVFERLRGGPASVGDLAHGMPISRPAVSQHLKVLREAGLVVSEAHGTRRVYTLDPRGIAALREWLDRFWDEALAAFKIEADRKPPRKGKSP